MNNKMRPLSSLSSHSNFFSSLKQVEKRLKLDPTSATIDSSQTQEESSKIKSQLGSLTLNSPMFLHLDQPSSGTHHNNSDESSSEAPQAFLSISQEEFPLTTHQESHVQTSPSVHLRTTVNNAEDDESAVDDIERLMQLLGLSEVLEQRDGFGNDNDANCCHYEDGFYSKIAGVVGPKCRKEVQRLDGWIKHFLKKNDSAGGGGDKEEKQEPLRLAHMLLGKAAFISEDGFGGLEFPSTIQEFLHTDPPSPSN